jgi:hypothetical protein
MRSSFQKKSSQQSLDSLGFAPSSVNSSSERIAPNAVAAKAGAAGEANAKPIGNEVSGTTRESEHVLGCVKNIPDGPRTATALGL